MDCVSRVCYEYYVRICLCIRSSHSTPFEEWYTLISEVVKCNSSPATSGAEIRNWSAQVPIYSQSPHFLNLERDASCLANNR